MKHQRQARTSRARILGWSACWGLAVLVVSPTAQAEQPSAQAKAAAQALFDEAKRLSDEGSLAEACPKFEASQQLDPAAGTLMSLALCYEQTGRTASAWSTYRSAESAATNAGQAKRAKIARGRAEVLAPRLSRLTVSVSREAAVPGLRVTRDGINVVAATWGVALPVDPGPHEVVAQASGREWRQTVNVSANAAQVVIDVPRLTAAQSAAPTRAAPSASGPPTSGPPTSGPAVTRAPAAPATARTRPAAPRRPRYYATTQRTRPPQPRRGAVASTPPPAPAASARAAVVVAPRPAPQRMRARAYRPTRARPPVATGPRPAPAAAAGISQRGVGIAVAAVGVVGLGIGTFFTLKSRSNENTASRHCGINGDPAQCDAQGLEANDAAIDAKRAATWSFVLGGIAVVGGVAIVLTEPKREGVGRLELRPVVGRGQGSLSLTGTW